MKKFWKEIENKRLEDFLIESIFYEVDFCFSFSHIPSPDFLKLFRAKHESDFIKLKMLNNNEDEDE
jgi:hypothetical protein